MDVGGTCYRSVRAGNETRRETRGGKGGRGGRKGVKAESEAETGAPGTGTERHGYETGFYQIISCHTDDDAAAAVER